jgi:Icc-related predicted phosphoesterase
MRCVFMADTHLFHEDLVVPDGDVLIHAGDICRRGSLDELAVFAALWRGFPHPHKVVVPGNHDWCFVRAVGAARAMLAESTVLIDEAARVGGLSIFGSPWQPEFGGWAFNLPRGQALREKWALIPEGLDVLVTHGPPHGYGDRTSHGPRRYGDDHSGCHDLRARVEVVRPRVHVFGHIHEDGGAWRAGDTLFANVTTWECERACTVIDVDATGAREVHVPPARSR